MAALGQAMVWKRKVGKVGSLHHALRTRGICDTIFSCSKCEAVAEVGGAGVGDRGCRLGKGRARGFWERLNVKVYLVGGHCSARGRCVFGGCGSSIGNEEMRKRTGDGSIRRGQSYLGGCYWSSSSSCSTFLSFQVLMLARYVFSGSNRGLSSSQAPRGVRLS